MSEISAGLTGALRLIAGLDPDFLHAVRVSVVVSSCAVGLCAIIGLPLGVMLGTARFRGRKIVQTIVNSMMSLPSVLVGLLLYSLLSRKGPFGNTGLLFTPAAMVMGQALMALPIMTAFIMNAVRSFGRRPLLAARRLGASPWQALGLYLGEIRFVISAALLASFGRVFGEVGVSLMLGGNIRFFTRNITTAITVEVGKGNLGMGIALGGVLMAIALFINVLAGLLVEAPKRSSRRLPS